MEHRIEIYSMKNAHGNTRWWCTCSCGWKIQRGQGRAYYAHKRGLDHITYEEKRVR